MEGYPSLWSLCVELGGYLLVSGVCGEDGNLGGYLVSGVCGVGGYPSLWSLSVVRWENI